MTARCLVRVDLQLPAELGQRQELRGVRHRGAGVVDQSGKAGGADLAATRSGAAVIEALSVTSMRTGSSRSEAARRRAWPSSWRRTPANT
jgi:hypothetical protein